MSSKIQLTENELNEIILDDRSEILRIVAEMGAYGEYENKKPINQNWKLFMEKEWNTLASKLVNLPTNNEKLKKETKNKMARVIQKFIKSKKSLKTHKIKCGSNSYLKKHKSTLRKCPSTMTCRKNPSAKGKKCFPRKIRKKTRKNHLRMVRDGIEL
tara:strand:+ start:1063 stop:1533 length:471 start_codon:yes stop_codon:yes gene_type:complete